MPMVTKDQVTYTVKQARVLSELSQEQMAARLGLSTSTYRKLEDKPDNITLRQARIISAATNQPFDVIFFE